MPFPEATLDPRQPFSLFCMPISPHSPAHPTTFLFIARSPQPSRGEGHMQDIPVSLSLCCVGAQNMAGDYPTIAHSYNSALSLRTNSIAAVSRLLVTTICLFLKSLEQTYRISWKEEHRFSNKTHL